jgi:hypothetical protein
MPFPPLTIIKMFFLYKAVKLWLKQSKPFAYKPEIIKLFPKELLA